SVRVVRPGHRALQADVGRLVLQGGLSSLHDLEVDGVFLDGDYLHDASLLLIEWFPRRNLSGRLRGWPSPGSGASSSLSRVIGKARLRLPWALYTAFATAAATPVMPISPTPRAPMGARGSGM